MSTVVAVRVNRPMGSRTMSVMTPQAAIVTITPSRTYLTRRRRGGRRDACRRAPLNLTPPRTVPSGQIQPHQNRPTTTVTTTVTTARESPGSQVRLESMVTKAASGSKRKNRLLAGAARGLCTASNSRYTKRASATPWVARRAQRSDRQAERRGRTAREPALTASEPHGVVAAAPGVLPESTPGVLPGTARRAVSGAVAITGSTWRS